jgi:hypothetical protein
MLQPQNGLQAKKQLLTKPLTPRTIPPTLRLELQSLPRQEQPAPQLDAHLRMNMACEEEITIDIPASPSRASTSAMTQDREIINSFHSIGDDEMGYIPESIQSQLSNPVEKEPEPARAVGERPLQSIADLASNLIETARSVASSVRHGKTRENPKYKDTKIDRYFSAPVRTPDAEDRSGDMACLEPVDARMESNSSEHSTSKLPASAQPAYE